MISQSGPWHLSDRSESTGCYYGNQNYKLNQAEGVRKRWPVSSFATMAPRKPYNQAATHEQILKEEEAIAKVKEYAKVLRRWEQGKAMCQEIAKQEERCYAKFRQRELAEMKEEVYFANKQLMLVRRAALRHLLNFEHMQYQMELNHLGKSFYVERL